MIDEALARIREKLALAQSRFPDRRFTLEPPLAPGEVADFEREHGIELPEDYRQFLVGLGAGGAGPLSGLLRLDEAWSAREDFKDYDNEDPDLPLAIDDGDEAWLILRGERRGRVEADGRCEAFLAWYERWLDGILAWTPDAERAQLRGDYGTALAALQALADAGKLTAADLDLVAAKSLEARMGIAIMGRQNIPVLTEWLRALAIRETDPRVARLLAEVLPSRQK